MRSAELLTVGDVAKVAAVSCSLVRWWDRSGKLPAIRTAGGVRLFDRADVERLAAERLRARSGESR
jgi:excisionase family DNA binding protein